MTEQLFTCPYCGQNSYAAKSKKKGNFDSWICVRQHTSKCKSNNKKYVISDIVGPIPIADIVTMPYALLKEKYPDVQFSGFNKQLKNLGFSIRNFTKDRQYTSEQLLQSIKDFVDTHGSIPAYRDFKNSNPSTTTICERFGTWNNAIEAAGFKPNLQNGYGIDTYGLDGHLYRSQAEAYFANTYLFRKYVYIIEPKYPEPYNRYYDWYIPSLDLYIELDGGIRPSVIDTKIKINTLLKRKLKIINTNSIYKTTFKFIG